MDMDDTIFLNMIKTTVEKYGCSIVDVDLENHILTRALVRRHLPVVPETGYRPGVSEWLQRLFFQSAT